MNTLKGTSTLIKLILRRDRVKLPVWIVAITGFVTINIPAIQELYGKDMQQQVTYATTSAASVVARAFGGPINGPEIGAIILNETFLFTAVLVAFMSTLLVVRHTRQNEETGREEMLSSGILGRHASLTAALVVAAGSNILLGALLCLTLMANDLSTSGAFGTGAAVAAIGIAFAGVAALTAQISESSRGANSMAAAVIGGAFLLRAAGDAMGGIIKSGTAIHSEWPSWLSPIGWGQQLHPFTEQNWLVFIPLGVFCASRYHRSVYMQRNPGCRSRAYSRQTRPIACTTQPVQSVRSCAASATRTADWMVGRCRSHGYCGGLYCRGV